MYDPNSRTAYVTAMASGALISALGMMAENMQRQQNGESMAYTEADFIRLINQYGVHHSAIVTSLGADVE